MSRKGTAFAKTNLGPIRGATIAVLDWQINKLQNWVDALSAIDEWYACITALTGIPYEEVRDRASVAWMDDTSPLGYREFLERAVWLCSGGQPPEWLVGVSNE